MYIHRQYIHQCMYIMCLRVCGYVCIVSTLVAKGMMVKTMAGKSAALHGLCHDATPFTFSESNPAVNHFGNLLVKGTVYDTFGENRVEHTEME